MEFSSKGNIIFINKKELNLIFLDEKSEDPVVLILSQFSSNKINSCFTEYEIDAFAKINNDSKESASLGKFFF